MKPLPKKASRWIYKYVFMKAIRVVVLSSPAMMLSMALFLLISWDWGSFNVGGQLSTGNWLLCLAGTTIFSCRSSWCLWCDPVMLSISWLLSSGINEVLTTKTTIDSPENDSKKLKLMAPSTRGWPCFILDENGDKTHVQGLISGPVQGSDWYLGSEQD